MFELYERTKLKLNTFRKTTLSKSILRWHNFVKRDFKKFIKN